jgi:hypothetical protein
LSVLALSVKRPGVAIGLLLVMFGFEQFLQTRSVLFINRGSLVNIGVGLTVAVAAGISVLRNLPRLSLDRMQLLCVLLIGYAYLSQIWTLSPSAFERYLGSDMPYFAVFLLLAPLLLMEKSGLQSGLRAAMFLGVPLICLFSLFVEWEGRGVRMAAPKLIGSRTVWFAPPLAISSMAANIGFLALILVSKNRLIRLIQIVGFALACYVAFRTQARGQLFAMAVVTLLAIPLANQASKLKGLFLTLAGFITAAVAVFLVFSVLDLGEVNRWRDSSIESGFYGRWEMITALLDKWSRAEAVYVIGGLGSGSSFEISGWYVHNLPAEILGELGLVGAALFGTIYFMTIRNCLRIIAKLDHYPEMRSEVVAAVALFAFATIISQKQGTLSSWPHLFFFAIVISHVELKTRHIVAQQLSLRRLFFSQNFAVQDSIVPGAVKVEGALHP